MLDATNIHGSAVRQLADLVQANPRLLVITGAGCSVASGIPSYRDAEGNWRHGKPIQHQEFVDRHAVRQRYWARSYIGWPPVANAQPNAAHLALVELEARHKVCGLITQNVDRLHQKAGQRRVIDLHGRLDQVVCLSCGQASPRQRMQERLARLNPHLASAAGRWVLAPDGDADVEPPMVDRMAVPPCEECGGVLKPDVVFFGASVPPASVRASFELLQECDALLVVGSSLMVFSGYRFCREAARLGKPVACINAGRTRADDLFSIKLSMDCGAVLQALLGTL